VATVAEQWVAATLLAVAMSTGVAYHLTKTLRAAEEHSKKTRDRRRLQ
jgi:hypothetical protein